jgi:hypothetical protein
VRYCCEAGFATISNRLDAVVRDFPLRPLAECVGGGQGGAMLLEAA